jgi:Putative transposase/IstB-like ATP binding protein
VFTLPAPVAAIAFHNKAAVYAILFRAAAETLITIAADPRHLGARVGITAVLHTWGQTLTHHPHVHCIVPGGGPSLDGAHWIACRPGFFLPVRVLSRLFRRLFLRDLKNAFEAGRLRFSGPLAGLDKTLFQQLATCRWIAEHRALLVTGPCGIGKSWLSCALAQRACRDGYIVTRTHSLISPTHPDVKTV